MQERLDKLYDEITDIENAIEEVETRLYNIRQDKISEDNVYQFLLFFDKLYDKFTDLEKKTFLKSFLSDVFIYEEEQKDGRILKGLRFKFPIYMNGRNVLGVDWDNESTDETVALLRRKDYWECLNKSNKVVWAAYFQVDLEISGFFFLVDSIW